MKDKDAEIADMLTEIMQAIFKRSNPGALRIFIEAIEREIVSRRGYENGRAAGTWIFDGNTSPQEIETVKIGINDGDPAVLDRLPRPRVGGEWAGEPTWEDILKEEGIRYDAELDHDGRHDLLISYEEAFEQGVQDEVIRYGEAF